MSCFKFGLLAMITFWVMSSSAAWYWPFGDDDEDKQPPRLHRLLEAANNLIEDAEDAALSGDSEKSLDLYQKALAELARVARENPDRAETPEFAPLRNKIATTQSAIDAIQFAKVRNGAKAVAVSDTTALEAKLRAEREGEDAPKSTARIAVVKKNAVQEPAEVKPSEEQKTDAPQAPTTKLKVTEKDEPKAVEEKDDSILDYKGKIRLAMKEIRNKDYVSADILLEDLVAERPNDLNALILRAAAQTGLGSYYAARRTLEKAHRAHPKNYIPCYNLAYLMFKIPGDNLEDAKQYYELGRGVGGPRDKQLEEKFR